MQSVIHRGATHNIKDRNMMSMTILPCYLTFLRILQYLQYQEKYLSGHSPIMNPVHAQRSHHGQVCPQKVRCQGGSVTYWISRSCQRSSNSTTLKNWSNVTAPILLSQSLEKYPMCLDILCMPNTAITDGQTHSMPLRPYVQIRICLM